MPRLTLRTLLAYIDDTLEPTEARSLGKKVAASDDAKELVERIKRVTRRRALATPEATSGDDATGDPNTVAEYLDNTLDSATLKQVEETCLTSDVHLAEVAACHQILTLVLTEPVRVPPRAHRRMYGLVPAPASLPNRRPNRTLPIGGAAPPVDTRPEADDADAALLLGMKRYSSATTWAARFALFGAAAVLLVLLTGAALLSLREGTHDVPKTAGDHSPSLTAATVQADPKKDKDESKKGTDESKKDKEKEPVTMPKTGGGEILPPRPVDVDPAAEMAREAANAIALAAADLAGKKPVDMVPQLGKVSAPSAKLEGIAKVEVPAQLVLVQTADGEWVRKPLEPGKREIETNRQVMALPGFKSNVLVNGTVQVHLWGNVPEQLQYRVFESRVVFHTPPEGFDADITLLAGRIYLKSKKVGPDMMPVGAKVRVRLAGEVWDVTLTDEKSDILLELISSFEPGAAFARKDGLQPRRDGRVAVWFGSAAFEAPNRPKKVEKFAAKTQIVWNSITDILSDPKPIEAQQDLQDSDRTPLFLDGKLQPILSGILADISKAVDDRPNAVRAVISTRIEPAVNVPNRDLVARLAVYSQTALADGPDATNLLKTLVDELGKIEPWYTRQAVVTALVNWLPRDRGNTATLHAVLVGKGASETEADLFLSLLRGFISPTLPNEERLDQLIGLLDESSTRLSTPAVGIWVREAALWNLMAADQMKWVPAGLADKAWISGAEVKSNEYQAFLKGLRNLVVLIKKRSPIPLPLPKR